MSVQQTHCYWDSGRREGRCCPTLLTISLGLIYEFYTGREQEILRSFNMGCSSILNRNSQGTISLGLFYDFSPGPPLVSNFGSCRFGTFPSVLDHGDSSCHLPSLRDAS